MTRARDVANIDGLLTTTGDTYYASAAGTPARLGIGSTDQVLKVTAGVPAWGSAPSASYTWTSYTPTWTGLTTGNGSLSFSEYLEIGKLVFYRGSFTFGSTTSVTGSAFAPSLPVAVSMNNGEIVGVTRYFDSGVGPFVGNISVYSNALESNINKVDATYQTMPQTSASIPMTWTTNDQFAWFITYKVA